MPLPDVHIGEPAHYRVARGYGRGPSHMSIDERARARLSIDQAREARAFYRRGVTV